MSSTTDTAVPQNLQRFVDALFLPKDIVLIRPVETWTNPDGTKDSKPLYKEVRHLEAKRLYHAPIWKRFLEVAEEKKANLFFGVCPRFGGRCQYDLAPQVRTVRVLWADLDHCTVEEALKRCEQAGLPRPSVIVSSGHGVHLYWILAEPYLIDDVGDPPAVYKLLAKGKKPRLYVKGADGTDDYDNLPVLGPRA